MKRLIVLFLFLWSSLSFANDNAYDLLKKGDDALENGDYAQAVELYKKACDMGIALGCNNLGILYEEGQGVSKNYEKAADLYKRACDMGVASGCYNLGNLYVRGKGVKQNYEKAKYFYIMACDPKLLTRDLQEFHLSRVKAKGKELGRQLDFSEQFSIFVDVLPEWTLKR